MTRHKTYLHHCEKGSKNTRHHYYADGSYRHSNMDRQQPTDPASPNDPLPDTDRTQRRWDRIHQRAANALDLSSDEGLTPANLDRVQQRWLRREQRARPADALSMASSDDDDDRLSATSFYVARHSHLNVNLKEHTPRVSRLYAYRSSELANPASTLRHSYIPPGTRLRGGGWDEEPPHWFVYAGGKEMRRLSIADRSLKEDLGFEDREVTRGRQKRRSKRRDSSASSDAASPPPWLKWYKTTLESCAAAQKSKKSRDTQIEADAMAAMFEQMLEDRRVREYYTTAMAQQCEDDSDSSSTHDLTWLQWQNYDVQRRAACEREGKVPEWTRSETRQHADFEQWKKMMKEKKQKKEYFRLRGKEIAIVRRSNTKRVTTLPSLLKMQKPKKTGKNKVNDAEWIDVPTSYEESGRLRWERRVRLLNK